MADDRGSSFDDNPEWDDRNTRPLSDASERLRAARAVLGLTQQELADLIGVSAATLRNWEQRRTTPDDAARTLIRLLAEHPREIQGMLRENAA